MGDVLLPNRQRSAAGRDVFQGKVVAQPCKGLGICVIQPVSIRRGLCHGKRVAQGHAGNNAIRGGCLPCENIIGPVCVCRVWRRICLLAQPFPRRNCKRHCARSTRLQGRNTGVRRKPVSCRLIVIHLNRHVAGVFHRHRLRVLCRVVSIGHLAKIQRGGSRAFGRGRGQQAAVCPRHLNLHLPRKITHRHGAQHGARIGVFHRDGASVIARRQVIFRSKDQIQVFFNSRPGHGRQHGRVGGSVAVPKLTREALCHSLVQLHFQAQRDVARVVDVKTLFRRGYPLFPIAEVQAIHR